ncbi:MAG: MerR family transcriptional regulator [Armatimonadota bacterium]|nr:MAG: MerR family transcriptional regulator [Armatimonadota bacterium]
MERDPGRPVYLIGVAAQEVGLSARTLRIYEQEGLIRPARKPGADQRLYSEQDLIWIRCISELIHGHSLTTVGIRRLLDLIPCWEIKHCPDDVARRCEAHLNIPDMATRAPADLPAAARPEKPNEEAQGKDAVEIKIFYGIKEFGVIFPCLKCIQAERIARRLAERHRGRVVVRKHDVLSEEADRHGVMMTPTVVVNGEVVASGKGLSASRLEQLLERHLSEGED